MKKLVTITLLLLNACGPDTFVLIGPVADSAGDAQVDPDAAARDGDAQADAPELDAGDASKPDAPDSSSCPYVGQVACSDTVNAYCGHYAACCQQFPGNGNCSVGWSNASGCKTFLTQNGFDCNAGKFNKLVCSGPTTCMNSTASATCNTLFLSTGPDANTLAGCPAFWGQF